LPSNRALIMKRYLLLLLFIAALQYRAVAQDIHFTTVESLIHHSWLNVGTGLGLSLTYDMVVKGHGGSIEVDTKENEYTLFTIKFPVQ
jgi:signal transduction histidine kinase